VVDEVQAAPLIASNQDGVTRFSGFDRIFQPDAASRLCWSPFGEVGSPKELQVGMGLSGDEVWDAVHRGLLQAERKLTVPVGYVSDGH